MNYIIKFNFQFKMEIDYENKNKLRIVIPGEAVASEKNGFMA